MCGGGGGGGGGVGGVLGWVFGWWDCEWCQWDCDEGRFFEFAFSFGYWSSGKDDGCKSGDGGGVGEDWGGCKDSLN